jgi:hypothetical protein
MALVAPTAVFPKFLLAGASDGAVGAADMGSELDINSKMRANRITRWRRVRDRKDSWLYMFIPSREARTGSSIGETRVISCSLSRWTAARGEKSLRALRQLSAVKALNARKGKIEQEK